MWKYADLAMIGIKEHTAYLNSVWANFLSKIIYLYMQYALWNALFSSNKGSNIPISHDGTIRYIIAATLISTFMECDVILWINNQIQSGDIVNQLIRPIDYRTMIFAKHIGVGAARIMIYTLPLGILTAFFYRGSLFCKEQLLYGAISILLAYLIQFLYSLATGMIAFWLIVTWPFNMFMSAVYKLLSGSWIPAAMFPELLTRVNTFLPFRAIYSIPVTIITTPMSLENIRENLCVQLIWLAVLLILSESAWIAGKNKLVVQGG